MSLRAKRSNLAPIVLSPSRLLRRCAPRNDNKCWIDSHCLIVKIDSLFPDRLAAAGQPKARPSAGDLLDHRLAHPDRPAPGAARLRRQFIGRIEADLAAEPGFG